MTAQAPDKDKRTLDLLDRLRAAGTAEDMFAELDRHLKGLGFEHNQYIFASLPDGPTPAEVLGSMDRFFSSHRTAFLEQYLELDMVGEDVGTLHCLHGREPVHWRDPALAAHLSESTLACEQLGWDHGLRNGLYVPLRIGDGPGRGGAGLSATGLDDGEFRKLIADYGREALESLQLFHQAVHTETDPATEHGLTGREREVLTWLATGMVQKQVADRMDIRPKTVEKHVASACAKLNARNATHAVAKAMVLGALRMEG